MRYTVSRQARRDILDSITFIASVNPAAAVRLRNLLFEAFNLLAAQPGLGHVREDLAPAGEDFRFWSVGTHLMIYGRRRGALQIVRVLSGRRDITAILKTIG